IDDTMDNTNNFHNPFGGEQVTANGDGTVTILRTQSGVDAGIDWMPGGAPIPVSGNENLTVSPVAPVNGGYWVPTIFLVDSNGNHEESWLGDTQATQPQEVNIPTFAATFGIVPTSYWLRLRMDPNLSTNVGFTFTQIDTSSPVQLPEPASLGMLGLGAVAFVRRRRA
ncbi:MAG TPA: PEP-CTERM sorting domain-containing protein, partial [Tepidisphaeraceae bacterium]|nr:PEP-CTERM sorting domain-containing protein [Tepidisphaeraceae bacterium]